MTTTYPAGTGPAAQTGFAVKLFFYAIVPTAVFFALMTIGYVSPAAYEAYFNGETAYLEILHIILPLIAAIMSFRLILAFRRDGNPPMTAFSVLAVAASVFAAGEEASYGQHFFGWEADGVFLELNDQRETNLHNIGSWFDQKPRAILEVITILAGLVVPFMQEWVRGWLPKFMKPYVTGFWFMPIAILIQLSELPKRLDIAGVGIIPDIRYSEFQEFFIFYFLVLAVWHISECRKRDIAGRAQA
ncbi:hypothetical protein HPQ64_12830 [Rhizobiales bacterium]|uniref:hypothetical protein n=1 Tax=Hongsoonwoonella zoysiae TaxID=2821844 RepID=UPI00155FD7C3|nr:hypothetical protein [Hongsoonwoonella zoysiae]NRG18575.1 hypothetical protein [Hongsoonwoonella zoysiae]